MSVSPAVRRAMHQALDIVLDAFNEPEAVKPKKRRGPCKPWVPTAEELGAHPLAPELQAQLDRQLEKAGYRKK